ncbi:PilN domain-containing protein [Candidatus Saccharibacteria bacterium]|nr:PilN domain-containing protein [Candidatus Saccharibacteria bacterium]
MMLQINLLPEARMLKLQAMARKRLATTITVVIGIVTATIIVTLLLLLGYTFSLSKANEARTSTLKKDISSQVDMEQKVATLQENLAAFASLQKSRLYVSEIFRNLGNVIPADVKINSFQISNDYLVTISGTAPNYVAVSTFSRTLQDYNVNFKPQPDLERKPLFTDPIITSVSKSADGTGTAGVTFSMTFKVDPSLFNKAIK